MSRGSKQTIIAVIFLLIFVGIGAGLYLVLKPEKINPPSAVGPSHGIETISSDYVISGINRIDLLAKIKNPNNDYGANVLGYHFDILNSKQEIVFSKSGQSYILAGQSKYLVEVGLDVKSNDIAEINLVLDNIVWEKTTDSKNPRLIIKDKTLGNSSSQGVTVVANGFLANDSNYDFNTVDIVAILYDNNDNIVGLGKTKLRTILSGEKRYFEINWDKLFSTRVRRLELEANTNILDRGNVLKINGEGGENFLKFNE